MSRFTYSLVSLMGLILLVACESATSTPSYTLTSILPSPVTPGETVTAYGVLPEAASLTLGETPVSAEPVASGLAFEVPETTLAGSHTLRVQTGKTSLSGVLQVLPRLDEITLEANTLTVTGAGWPSHVNEDYTVTLLVAGQTYSPQLAQGRLSATIPDLPAGTLSVQVRVGGSVSAVKRLSREAAAVTGKVLFPASDAELGSQSVPRQTQRVDTSALTSLIVRQASDRLMTLAYPQHQADTLPMLDATRLRFTSPDVAQAAYTFFHEAGLEVEWDLPVHLDGLTTQQVTDPSPGDQWFQPLIGLDTAWEVSQGEGVIVAVLDTGVDLDHPDLVGSLLPGYDFIDGDYEPLDHAGHGSHVAGLVAARGKVSGVAPEARILPVRVLEGTAGGSSFTVAQGVLYAAGLLDDPVNPTPAQVINLSLGTASYSAVIADAVNAALDAGVIVVAASGNQGTELAFPASMDGVISVTALAGPVTPYQPWYANKGTGLQLTGYGGDMTQDQDGDGKADGILSTDLNGYSFRNGTSMAAPQISGLAALALASGTPPALVSSALAGTATELGSFGYDHAFGHGLASGRVVGGSEPRSYVLALDEAGRILHWTLLAKDGSFTLNDLPSGQRLTLLAASDDDGDGLLAEAGELRATLSLDPLLEGQLSEAEPFTLNVSDGSGSLPLEAF